jgi:nitrate/nitrite-specific signal transduction histidine kinase
MSMEIVSTIVTVVLPVSTFVGGIVAWYSASVKKAYAAQRDFEHLRRNYNQMSENLKSLHEDVDDRFDDLDKSLSDLKQKLNVIMIKVLPETSTGWVKGNAKE